MHTVLVHHFAQRRLVPEPALRVGDLLSQHTFGRHTRLAFVGTPLLARRLTLDVGCIWQVLLVC